MELLERIGSGAYGEVWLARNAATGARRAVKIVYRATFTDERPFHREFEGIKKFESISHSHPSQLSLFQVGRNDEAGYFYYVMELADSVANSASYQARTLRSELSQGRLPAARALEIALALTEALAHLHANGLIHRDVKPSNIIFVQGRPKLADIGLVTDASDSRSIVGTEGYLPAEGPGTPQADLFALGKVLYEALTGLDRRQYPELPADLRTWPDAKLAFELNTILLKACAAHPSDRYATADALLADLKLLDSGKSIQRRRTLQRTLIWTWRTAAVSSALFFVFWLIHNQRLKDKALATLNASAFERSGTTNRAAWEAYARAEGFSLLYTPGNSSNAVTHYERAIQLDPNFTRAWESLSSTLAISVDKGFVSGAEVLPRSRVCAKRASDLNPSSARAAHWLAFSIVGLEYDFRRAEPIFRKAIKLDPKEWVYRHNFAYFLWFYGRLDESESMLNNELRDDPSIGYAYACLGQIYGSRGQFPEALKALSECILLKPTFPGAYFERGEFLWTLNRRTEAVSDWLRFLQLDGIAAVSREDTALLGTRFGNGDPDDFVRGLIALLERRLSEGRYVSAYDLARFHALAGNKTRALDYLEQAVEEHRPFTLSAKMHIAFRDLRDEPRFLAVLRRLKLEP